MPVSCWAVQSEPVGAPDAFFPFRLLFRQRLVPAAQLLLLNDGAARKVVDLRDGLAQRRRNPLELVGLLQLPRDRLSALQCGDGACLGF